MGVVVWRADRASVFASLLTLRAGDRSRMLGAPSSRDKSLYPIARWPYEVTDLLPGHLDCWI